MTTECSAGPVRVVDGTVRAEQRPERFFKVKITKRRFLEGDVGNAPSLHRRQCVEDGTAIGQDDSRQLENDFVSKLLFLFRFRILLEFFWIKHKRYACSGSPSLCHARSVGPTAVVWFSPLSSLGLLP